MKEFIAAFFASALKLLGLFNRSVTVTERMVNAVEDVVRMGEDEARFSYTESSLKNRKRLKDLAEELGLTEDEVAEELKRVA